MAEFGFGQVLTEEKFVFGAQRPGFPGKFVQKQLVDDWLSYMKKQGIANVVCLLSEEELKYFPTLAGGLLGTYVSVFGENNVLWAPTEDRHLPSSEAIAHICHFLYRSAEDGQKTVVHCSGGVGRTGVVLAAWLVYGHRMTERKAIKVVEELNRNCREAVFHHTAIEADLLHVLGTARELEMPAPES